MTGSVSGMIGVQVHAKPFTWPVCSRELKLAEDGVPLSAVNLLYHGLLRFRGRYIEAEIYYNAVQVTMGIFV